MSNSDQTVGAVERAADILDYLYEKNAECPLSAIAADLGFYKSTVHRMLATLKARGYVYQNPVTSTMAWGYAYFCWAAGCSRIPPPWSL